MPFLPGNTYGTLKKGYKSPHNIEAIAFKQDLIKKTLARKGKINDALLNKAETGDIPAIREVNDRVMGSTPLEVLFSKKVIGIDE
jgi:hypothetical protein